MEQIINKPIRLVCEGPDLTGKSNICAALSKVLSIPVYKSGREASLFNEKDAQFNVLRWGVYEQIRTVEVLKASIIYDRFFPSEFVYSRVYNRKSDEQLVFKYDKWWADLDGVIVFLDKENMDGIDLLVKKNEYSKLREGYEEYFHKTVCRKLRLDTTNRNLEQQIKIIIEFIYQ